MSLPVDHPAYMSFLPVSVQLSNGPAGLHEEREPGALLPGKTGHSVSLIASGDLPAQTGAKDS